MKTTFIKTIVCIAVLVAGVIGSEVKAQNQFVTNDEVTDGVITSRVIYRNEGSLYRHAKYDFAYDELGRMTEKSVSKWNSVRNKWEPHYKMSFSYTDTEIVINYGKWNDKKKDYSKSNERSVYELNESNMPVACVIYKWDKKDSNWSMVNKIYYEGQPIYWTLL
ncbi:MAG: DUF3836 domain-containing protein [Bacteroides sp.]|nr:DUF3836 domain-containing protein [Bacteroides sp.]